MASSGDMQSPRLIPALPIYEKQKTHNPITPTTRFSPRMGYMALMSPSASMTLALRKWWRMVKKWASADNPHVHPIKRKLPGVPAPI